MRTICQTSLACLLFAAFSLPATAQQSGPTDVKAQKTYADAVQAAKGRDQQQALELFRKADKQDGHHCIACALHAADFDLKLGNLKQLHEEVAEIDGLHAPVSTQAAAHYLLGVGELRNGQQDHKDRDFADADAELQKVIALNTEDKRAATYLDGVALANLHQDEAAKARFHAFLETARPGSVEYGRAERFQSRPELARARMAPPFALTTLSGQAISLDRLAGKVVLIDFWATWCGPCREALPHMQKIAQKFAGQPLVILSVSLDKDEAKWKDFVAKNNMTWAQYRDGGFDGQLAERFAVHAIPATFTIDADGVLQDQHVGDAAIEGKLKKLVAEANRSSETASAGRSGGQ